MPHQAATLNALCWVGWQFRGRASDAIIVAHNAKWLWLAKVVGRLRGTLSSPSSSFKTAIRRPRKKKLPTGKKQGDLCFEGGFRWKPLWFSFINKCFKLIKAWSQQRFDDSLWNHHQAIPLLLLRRREESKYFFLVAFFYNKIIIRKEPWTGASFYIYIFLKNNNSLKPGIGESVSRAGDRNVVAIHSGDAVRNVISQFIN